MQYSDYIDEVTITATDVTPDTMTATTSWSVDGGGFTSGLPSSLILSSGGCTTNGVRTCTWGISGIATIPAGDYTIRVTITDKDGGVSNSDISIEVLKEDATVTFDENNDVAIEVASEGGNSGSFTLTAIIKESYDGSVEPNGEPNTASGAIGLAGASAELVPVGPGGPIPGTLTDYRSFGSGSDYNSYVEVDFTFNNIPVNTYSFEVTVEGNYYTGSSEDVLVVFDPSLGFTTGGGWFYWPEDGSAIAGAKTNFGYTMKYNKKGNKVQGNLLMIAHLEDGSIHRIKSNAIYGLSLGDGVGFGWASFSGKCTYKEHDWPEPIGNYEFIVYVEDWGEPGKGVDKFWIEVIDGISMERPAIINTVTIHGGNIVVPHIPN
jgi:hypothetical protein